MLASPFSSTGRKTSVWLSRLWMFGVVQRGMNGLLAFNDWIGMTETKAVGM